MERRGALTLTHIGKYWNAVRYHSLQHRTGVNCLYAAADIWGIFFGDTKRVWTHIAEFWHGLLGAWWWRPGCYPRQLCGLIWWSHSMQLKSKAFLQLWILPHSDSLLLIPLWTSGSSSALPSSRGCRKAAPNPALGALGLLIRQPFLTTLVSPLWLHWWGRVFTVSVLRGGVAHKYLVFAEN